MKASVLEFRLRYLVHLAIFVLGFTAPWNYLVTGAPGFWADFFSRKALWLPAALEIERAGWMPLTGATNLLLGLGIVFLLAAAILRTWAAAYLGPAAVKDRLMQGSAVMEDGPFRYLRNPLYLGTLLHTLGLALLMPPSGAAFAVAAIGVVQMRLIGGEEAFLTRKLGQIYLDYKARVPSLWPAVRPSAESSGTRPAWGIAALSEVYFWGAAVAFASLGMRYNTLLVTQGVVVALGVSMVARAFVPGRTA